jgi:hypothetical protein
MAVEKLESDLDLPTTEELREVAIVRDMLKVYFQISTKLCSQKNVVASEVTQVFSLFQYFCTCVIYLPNTDYSTLLISIGVHHYRLFI